MYHSLIDSFRQLKLLTQLQPGSRAIYHIHLPLPPSNEDILADFMLRSDLLSERNRNLALKMEAAQAAAKMLLHPKEEK